MRRPTPEGYLSDLNDPQREAVLHTEGPLLVIAGAGSGKTRVLTRRVAHLIGAIGVQPNEILAITFTNKAAAEMRERLEELLGPTARAVWILTFHAACGRILRREAERLGYKQNFTIYDTADQLRVVKDCLEEMEIDPKRFPARAILTQISNAKNQLISPEENLARVAGFYDQTIARVYEAYQKRLFVSNAVDFDDMLTLVVEILERFPDAKERWAKAFRYILVDEYQDTNHAQYRLLQLLATRHRNVCVVGDPDQSIYAFRGADIRNILQFEEAYPDVTTVVLDQNYRSTQTILDAANTVIDKNLGRKPKQLWSEKGGGEQIVRYHAQDEQDEAQWVARMCTSYTSADRYRWGDIAVFYRTNAQSRVIEEAFMRMGVPYKVVGGTRFYDRKEIKDAVAYLKAVVNPADEVSIKRVINEPKRGVGDTSISRLDSWANTTGQTFSAALRRADETGVSGVALRGIGSFVELVDALEDYVADGPAAVLRTSLVESRPVQSE